MAEPVVKETLASNIYHSFSSEFDSISISPSFDNFNNSSSDQALPENSNSDLRFLIDGDGDFQLDFENIHDLYIPSENDPFFVVPVDATTFDDFTPASGDCFNDDADKKTNCLLSSSSCCIRESPIDSDCSGTTQSLTLSTQESANCLSSSLESVKIVADQKLKVEEATTFTKRKKEIAEDTKEESRNYKYRRLNEEGDGTVSLFTGGEEDEEKKNTRLIKNRESAQLSRQRKKQYVEELEDKVKNMHSTIKKLNSKLCHYMAENATLRQQVGPRNGMMAPMAYPWMQFPGYTVKPQGSRVPLLPIPRLKPQQSMAKVKKGRTKKVASVSVLGVLFCLVLFGALAPIMNISYGEYDQSRGRILDINSNRTQCGRDSDKGVGRNLSACGRDSEPLAASLFVPRNDKLVKIDGSLIIHSVLASEKAMASGKSSVATVPKGMSPALPLLDSARTGDMSKHIYTPKAVLSDTSKDQLKSTTDNGKMQQWFHEDVAGPMFSSGMCTEVFQFDISTTSGAIIPASPPENTTNTHKGEKNRRISRARLPVSDFNLTKYHSINNRETKPATSMVVSVLVDPRESGDGDIDGIIGGTKPLSRVFVVVLVDGMKYVTYSCVFHDHLT